MWDLFYYYYDIFDINFLVCEEYGYVVGFVRWINRLSNLLNLCVFLEDNGLVLFIVREFYCKVGYNRYYICSIDGDFLRYFCENYFIELLFNFIYKCGFILLFVKILRSYIFYGLFFNMF